MLVIFKNNQIKEFLSYKRNNIDYLELTQLNDDFILRDRFGIIKDHEIEMFKLRPYYTDEFGLYTKYKTDFSMAERFVKAKHKIVVLARFNSVTEFLKEFKDIESGSNPFISQKESY